MDESIESLIDELNRRQPYVSGATIVEIFGKAALDSWAGALALIDAFNELERSTGEPPSRGHITPELYLALKSYWSSNLGDDLVKLDRFLKKVSS